LFFALRLHVSRSYPIICASVRFALARALALEFNILDRIVGLWYCSSIAPKGELTLRRLNRRAECYTISAKTGGRQKQQKPKTGHRWFDTH
jgi:hypothetical protein